MVGTGAIGANAVQGFSVSISADGNTAIVGEPVDNSNVGAAWIYTRSGGVWTQQGTKLLGTGAVGNAYQVRSVSISADGNTAIVSGYWDNSYAGTAWVYTRSGGVWTQQCAKLVGQGAVGNANQGRLVSILPDGNTVIVDGDNDNPNLISGGKTGAAWIYTRSGGVWTQQGANLVGTGGCWRSIARHFCFYFIRRIYCNYWWLSNVINLSLKGFNLNSHRYSRWRK